jgi:hypothetical protein
LIIEEWVDGVSFEDDQDSRHVVTSDTRHGVGGYESFEQFFYNFLNVLLFELLFYDIYDALVVLHIILPNTIAT